MKNWFSQIVKRFLLFTQIIGEPDWGHGAELAVLLIVLPDFRVIKPADIIPLQHNTIHTSETQENPFLYQVKTYFRMFIMYDFINSNLDGVDQICHLHTFPHKLGLRKHTYITFSNKETFQEKCPLMTSQKAFP